jgi:hypothetical protein
VNAAAISAARRKPLRRTIDGFRARRSSQYPKSPDRNPDEADETFRAEHEAFSAGRSRSYAKVLMVTGTGDVACRTAPASSSIQVRATDEERRAA